MVIARKLSRSNRNGKLTEFAAGLVFEGAEAAGLLQTHVAIQNQSGHGLDHLLRTNAGEIVVIEDKATSRQNKRQLSGYAGSAYPGVPAASQREGAQAYGFNRLTAARFKPGYSIVYNNKNDTIDGLRIAFRDQIKEGKGVRGYVLQLTRFGDRKQKIEFTGWTGGRPYTGKPLTIFGYPSGTSLIR